MYFDKHIEYAVAATFCAAAGALFDIKTRKIPNRLVLAGLFLGLLLHTIYDGGWGLLDSFGAAMISGFIFFFFYLMGGMGGGDVKLMAAVSAIAGMSNIPYLLVLTALTGGVMALGLAVMRGRLKETIVNVSTLTVHHLGHGLSPHPELNVQNDNTLRLPYGVAIALGCMLTFCLRGVQ
jgi:prepilin peptidase CpaA